MAPVFLIMAVSDWWVGLLAPVACESGEVSDFAVFGQLVAGNNVPLECNYIHLAAA